MDKEKLGEILRLHEEWLKDSSKGSRANLSGADLSGANLSRANLLCANLSRANLSGAKGFNGWHLFRVVPTEGQFIGYKKVNDSASGKFILTLLIVEDAKRSNAPSERKCRCSKATVLKAETLEFKPTAITRFASSHDVSFVYEIGQTVEVKDFDENFHEVCAPGIHFFLTKEEARDF